MNRNQFPATAAGALAYAAETAPHYPEQLALAGIAETGPIPPPVSELSEAQMERLRPIAKALRSHDG